MKRSLKRLLGTVLALVLLFSALPAVGAATNLYVGGVAMSEGSYLALGADSVSSTRPDGGYAHYQNGVLTLHDYTYQGSGYNHYAVYAAGDLSVRLEGSSLLEQTDNSADSAAIRAKRVTVSAAAGGELTVKTAGGSGIEADSLSVNSGKLLALAPWAIYLSGGSGKLTVGSALTVFALERGGADYRLVSYDAEKLSSYGGMLIQKADSVYVGGVLLEDGKYLSANGAVTTFPAGGSYAHYENGVLTLHNYHYRGDGYAPAGDDGHYGIYAASPLLVQLEGENSIRLNNSYNKYLRNIGAPMLAIDAAAGGKLNGNFGSVVVDGSFAMYGGEVLVDGTDTGIRAGSVYMGGGLLVAQSHGAAAAIDSPFVHAHRGTLVAVSFNNRSALSCTTDGLRVDAPLRTVMGDSHKMEGYNPNSAHSYHIEISQPQSVERLYGASRYDTAFAAADALKAELGGGKFNAIVVASGENFADALAGSYLAARKSAPILLTNNANMADVLGYIRSNLRSGGTVYALGGTAVVSDSLKQVAVSGFTFKRLNGANRFETNLEILKEAGIDSGMPVLVCNAYNFPDSLSASAVGLPILLTDDSLTQQQLSFLRKNSDGSCVLVGGTGAVSATVEQQLRNDGCWLHRLAGVNRFETSVLLAEFFYDDAHGVFDTPDKLTLTYAYNFPDGLCAGPLAYALNAPLILTAGGDEAAAAHYANTLGIRQGVVLGGPSLVTESSVTSILSLR